MSKHGVANYDKPMGKYENTDKMFDVNLKKFRCFANAKHRREKGIVMPDN
jgi:hypothetical protein